MELSLNPKIKELCSAIWAFLPLYQEFERKSESPLLQWAQATTPTLSPAQEARKAFAIETIELAFTKASHGNLLVDDVIAHVLYFNEAVVEPSDDPNEPFQFTPMGRVNSTKAIEQPGISIPCLAHLLDGGLLSESPRERPTCSLYRRDHFDPDFGPCKGCPRKQ